VICAVARETWLETNQSYANREYLVASFGLQLESANVLDGTVRERLFQIAVLCAVAAAVYLNTVPNGLVVDDVQQIVENEWITGSHHLRTIFTSGVWDFEGRASSYYRPAMYVLYMATYSLAGRAAWAYHLLNILFHVAATLLVAVLAWRVFPRSEPQHAPLLAPWFIAGLLFAVHPIHTEAVAWSAGIADLGLTVFGLLAVVCHIEAAERGWSWDIAAAAAWCAALLSKETAFVIPLLAAAYDLIFLPRANRANRLRNGIVVFAPAAALYIGLRVHALRGLMPTAGGLALAPSAYGLAVLALLAGYIEKLVLPVNLNFWHAFTPPAALLSAEALRAATIVGLAVAAAIFVFANRTARFAVLLTIVPLLPTFHLGALNQGLENAFAERYLYLPSVGFVLLVALMLDSLRVRNRPHWAAAVAAVLLAGSYAVATVARNPVWKDQLTLWTDTVRKSPHSGIAHMNYGAALIYSGRKAEGSAEMRRAATMNPGLVERQLVLATMYVNAGLWMKAILALHTTLALDPTCAPARYNLGLVYESQGQVGAASAEYERALALNPNYAEAHNNLGVLQAEQRDMERALVHFREAVRLRPDDPVYRANLERAERSSLDEDQR
jgi:Flp pilus assembly protein TadD